MATSQTQTRKIEETLAPINEGLIRSGETLKKFVAEKDPFIVEFFDHILSNPGKRIRPGLTLLSSGFHPADHTKIENMATAVELLHIATLVHDDTIDKAQKRRGKDTITKKWGTNLAIMIGDYVGAASARFVCLTGEIQVIDRFAETIMELAEGQLQETVELYSPKQNMESYLERIYKKTASLFMTACQSGAILSGANEDIIRSLTAYGYNVGMAYQIVDDILDLTGNEVEFGKPTGQDLRGGILTMPTLIAVEKTSGDSPVLDYLSNPKEIALLNRSLEAATSSEVIAESYEIAGRYAAKAVEHLSSLENNEYRRSLQTLAESLQERRY